MTPAMRQDFSRREGGARARRTGSGRARPRLRRRSGAALAPWLGQAIWLTLACGDPTGSTGDAGTGATGGTAGTSGASSGSASGTASTGSSASGTMGSTSDGTTGSTGGDTGGGCDPQAVVGMFCFTPVEPHALVAGDRPMQVAVDDLDQDGVLDVVTADIITRNVSLLRGASGGAFWPPSVLKVDDVDQNQALGGPSNLRTADFDGDGLPDLLVSNYRTLPANSGALVFRNQGDMTFADFDEYVTPQPIFAIDVGDVDGDGDIDFLAARDVQSADVYLNDGTGAFSLGAALALGGTSLALSVRLADLDEDGDLDAVVAQTDMPQVFMGAGDGTFGAAKTHAQGASAYNLHLVDVDADGRLDLVSAGASHPAGAIEVSLGAGDGSFGAPMVTAAGFAPTDENYAIGITAGDLDRDGVLDLAATRILSAASPGEDGISLLKGAGDGTFSQGPTIAQGFGPYSMAIADVTGDGEDDLLSVAIGDNTVHVLAYDPCACAPGG